MKRYIIAFTICILGWISEINAQNHSYANNNSAIYVQLPFTYRNSEITIRGRSVNIQHRGTAIYVANLFPDNYQITVRNGGRIIQTPLRLQGNMILNLSVAPNGRLIQNIQRNNAYNPYPPNSPNAPFNNRNNGFEEKYDTEYNPSYDARVPHPETERFQDWMEEFRKISFDSKKVDYLKNTLDFELDYATAKEILTAFDSDFNRIKAAKIVLDFINNRSALGGLSDTFTHDSYKKEYQQLLSTER